VFSSSLLWIVCFYDYNLIVYTVVNYAPYINIVSGHICPVWNEIGLNNSDRGDFSMSQWSTNVPASALIWSLWLCHCHCDQMTCWTVHWCDCCDFCYCLYSYHLNFLGTCFYLVLFNILFSVLTVQQVEQKTSWWSVVSVVEVLLVSSCLCWHHHQFHLILMHTSIYYS